MLRFYIALICALLFSVCGATSVSASATITSASVTPQNLLAANGTITVSASAVYTIPPPNVLASPPELYCEVIDSSGADIYDESLGYAIDNNASSISGSSTFDLGSNEGPTPLSYTVKIVAVDGVGNTSTKDFPVMQAVFQQITINGSVTPENPPAENGMVTIKTSVADPNGATTTDLYYTVYEIIYGFKLEIGYGSLDSSGQATVDLGANTSDSPVPYVIEIDAYDDAGETEQDIDVTQAIPVSIAYDSDKSLGEPGDGQPPAGEPINVATGNVYDDITDYKTAGPNPLAFTRYYNSQTSGSPFAGMMGQNWRNSFDRYLWLVSSASVGVERANGQVLYFTASNGVWTSDSDVGATLTHSGSSWVVTDTDDSVETYSSASSSEARLTSIKARGGYTQTLSYNAANQLTSVTDTYQRTLSFTYQGGLLQTVTTPDGLVLTYGYDTGGQSPGGPNRLRTVTYSTEPITSQTYLYENPNLPMALTAIIDENGNRYTSWTYDQKSRGLTSQFGSGATLTTVSYNDTDGSRTVTNALGQQEVYQFTTLQGIPKLTSISRLPTATTAAATETFYYDSNGYESDMVDWNGNDTAYLRDALGRPTLVIEGDADTVILAGDGYTGVQARVTFITYNGSFHLPSTVTAPQYASDIFFDANGNIISKPQLTTSYVYDSDGNLLTKTLTDTTTTTVPYATHGQTKTYIYTWENALPTSVQNPRTDVNALTSFAYDTSGALVKTTNALGQMVQVTQHTPGGLPLTVVDANGVTTQFTYDGRQRLTSSAVSTSAGVLTTHYVYDPAGNLLTVTLPDGSATTNHYDTAHRLTSTTDLLGQTITYTLDANGKPTQTEITTAAGAVQRQRAAVYDALGRLILDTGGAGQLTRYAYDSNGNVVTITDPLLHLQSRTYDRFNRLTSVIDATHGVTTTTYDSQDHPRTVTGPNNGKTIYTYDGFEDLTETSSPDTHNTVYVYDADGNVTEKIDATRAIVNYTYDALDRVTAAAYPGDAAENVTYTYDQGSFGVGRLTSLKDAAGTLGRTYDERGNVLKETRFGGPAFGSGATLSTSYAYDAVSRIASTTYPSGITVSNVRDVMGRTTAMTLRRPGSAVLQTVVSNIGYEPLGPINALLFGNGITETRSFDADYRLTGIGDAGMTTLQNLTYGYDATDNVQTIIDAVTPASSQSFQYDALNRLTQAIGGYTPLAYTYDHMGNRIAQAAGSAATTYAYAPVTNHLSTVTYAGSKQAVGYTLAGNISTLSAGLIRSLTYNQAGRLTSVNSATSVVVQYVYDAFGERLGKASPAGQAVFQYDQQGHLLQETVTNGGSSTEYIYLDDGRLIATVQNGTASLDYIHADRLGTPQLATNDAQAVVWSAAYQPFGLANAGGSVTQNLRLPGQYADAETGWYQNGFRDYVPGLGRYLESDPIGLGGGLNTYAYAGGNPVARYDVTGLNPDSTDSSDNHIIVNIGGVVSASSGQETDSAETGFVTDIITGETKDYLTSTKLSGPAAGASGGYSLAIGYGSLDKGFGGDSDPQSIHSIMFPFKNPWIPTSFTYYDSKRYHGVSVSGGAGLQVGRGEGTSHTTLFSAPASNNEPFQPFPGDIPTPGRMTPLGPTTIYTEDPDAFGPSN